MEDDGEADNASHGQTTSRNGLACQRPSSYEWHRTDTIQWRQIANDFIFRSPLRLQLVASNYGTTASSHETTASSHGTTASSPVTIASSHGTTASSQGTTASSQGTTASSHGTTASSHGTTASSHGTKWGEVKIHLHLQEVVADGEHIRL